jgi:hypothetical protein
VENELVTAQSEDPEHFLVLLKTLTDRHYLSRSEVRCFIDSKCENVTPTRVSERLSHVPLAVPEAQEWLKSERRRPRFVSSVCSRVLNDRLQRDQPTAFPPQMQFSVIELQRHFTAEILVII